MSVIQGVFDIVNIKVDPYIPVYVNNLAYVTGLGELLKRTSARTIGTSANNDSPISGLKDNTGFPIDS